MTLVPDDPVLGPIVTTTRTGPAAGGRDCAAVLLDRVRRQIGDDGITAVAVAAPAWGPGTWALDDDPPATGRVALLAPGPEAAVPSDGTTSPAPDVDHVPPAAVVDVTDLVVEPRERVPGLAAWGAHAVRPASHAELVAVVVVDDRPPGRVADLPPTRLLQVLLGARALGLAARFRDAFLDRARGVRGWSRVRTVDDPMALAVLREADQALDGAAALLDRRAADLADASGPEAEVLAGLAGLGAVEAARRSTTSLMTLSGAGALYDHSPLQDAFGQLTALAGHPVLDRSARLRGQRRAVATAVDSPPTGTRTP